MLASLNYLKKNPILKTLAAPIQCLKIIWKKKHAFRLLVKKLEDNTTITVIAWDVQPLHWLQVGFVTFNIIRVANISWKIMHSIWHTITYRTNNKMFSNPNYITSLDFIYFSKINFKTSIRFLFHHRWNKYKIFIH